MDTHYFRVAGMKRSCNHGIMNWLLGLYPGRFYFHNCCGNPNAEGFLQHSSSPIRLGQHHPDYIPVTKNGNKQIAIVSYEDFEPSKVFPEGIEKTYGSYFGASRYTNVLILRDPYNMAASRLKREYSPHHWVRYPISDGRHEDLADLWKQYARLFIKKEEDPDWLCICFNRWFKDITYRQQLAAKLMQPFTDVGFRGCGTSAGRSSFEKHGNTRRYDMENRWKHFTGHPGYRLFIKDKELKKLSQRITGFTLPMMDSRIIIKMKPTGNFVRL